LIEDPQSSEDLEARSRELRGTIGIATGVLLGPVTVLGFYLVLKALEPRALGTYSFLISGPLVLALLAARAPQRGILKSFGMTLTGISVLAAVMYLTRLELVRARSANQGRCADSRKSLTYQRSATAHLSPAAQPAVAADDAQWHCWRWLRRPPLLKQATWL